MTPRDQDALNRRLQREAAERQAAQRVRNEQARRDQEAANRRASDKAKREFNEGQERIRRENEAKLRKEQERQKEHKKYMDKLRRQTPQQPWVGSSVPYTSPPPAAVDYDPGSSSGRSTSKRGGFGRALLIVTGLIVAIGYFGSHSDRSSPTPTPEATPSSPTPSDASPPHPVQPTPAEPAPAPMPIQLTPTPAPGQPANGPQADAPASAPIGEPQTSRQPYPALPPSAPTLQVVSKVQPIYPPLAKQARIGGTVTVLLEVAPDGSVIDARAEHGSPILVKAAIDAARQWRYEPYTPLPGQPPFMTTVNFNFNLQ